ncbi:MAG: DUF3592 domain-containing protein [Rubrivivax sp.]
MKRLRWLPLFVLFSLLLVALLGAGGWLLKRQTPEIWEGWRSLSWPAATARVERSVAIRKYRAAIAKQSGQGTHVLELRYAFEVAGKAYVGGRRSLDWEGKVLSAASAEKLAQRSPAGSEVTAYYDPADPTRSLLEPGVPIDGALGAVLGLLLIAGGLALLLLVVRMRVRDTA